MLEDQNAGSSSIAAESPKGAQEYLGALETAIDAYQRQQLDIALLVQTTLEYYGLPPPLALRAQFRTLEAVSRVVRQQIVPDMEEYVKGWDDTWLPTCPHRHYLLLSAGRKGTKANR